MKKNVAAIQSILEMTEDRATGSQFSGRFLGVAGLRKRNWSNKACAVLLLYITTVVALPAQTFNTLHSFDGTSGSSPEARLVQATTGDLYGTTSAGGAHSLGTVFKIIPSGTLTTLYNFCSQSRCTDGSAPAAGLIQASDGDFYGTTFAGGTHKLGTVFKITPSGTLTTLYSFCSQSGCSDGSAPSAGLVQSPTGSFYGTTADGGANSLGTVFKIIPSGTLTTLYSFCSQSGCTDGSAPEAGLVQAPNGNLYGTTAEGGAHSLGTVFKITPSGTLTTLYSLCSQSGCSDGSAPTAGLIQASDGDFYGTTVLGGLNNAGIIFKITPNGTLTVLHSFDGTDGNVPGGLFQATNGKLYGTTFSGGADNLGTVFSLALGLRAFVETQPTSAKVGAAVKILGTNLTGATSVTFNGTVATFTVVSGSLITTSVPTNATSGFVMVTAPSAILKSNERFSVTP